jgi:hypothetical protein
MQLRGIPPLGQVQAPQGGYGAGDTTMKPYYFICLRQFQSTASREAHFRKHLSDSTQFHDFVNVHLDPRDRIVLVVP